MKKKRLIMLSSVAVLAIMVVLSGHAQAQQKVIELTYGTPWGADHTFSIADKKWIAKIEKETNGRVKITPYWGGQIIGGQNQVEELAAGAADIGYILPVNSKTGFQIGKATMLFFAGANDNSGSRAFKALRAKFPEIEKEYTDAGIKPLQWQGMVNEIISRKPVRKLADVKGLRIKVIGDYSKVFAALGAEGVSISNADVYVNMQKGILDATTAPMEVVESLKFADVAKYVPMFGFYPAPQSQRAMNLSKWKSLPPDIQKVFENNVDYWEQVTLEAVAAANAHAMEFGKKAGVEFIPISAEDKAKLQTLTVSIAEKDAKDLDAKGIRATQILQESQRLIKQYAK